MGGKGHVQRAACVVESIHTRNTQVQSYTAFKLSRGQSFQRFLSLNEVASTKRQKQLPADFNERYSIKMHRIPDALRATKQQVKCGSTPLAVVHKSVEELNSGESRGSVTVFDELGCQLTLDKTNGELYK